MVLVNTADDHNFLLNNVSLIYYCPYKGHLIITRLMAAPLPEPGNCLHGTGLLREKHRLPRQVLA